MNKKLFSWKALAGLALLVAMGMTSCKNNTEVDPNDPYNVKTPTQPSISIKGSADVTITVIASGDLATQWAKLDSKTKETLREKSTLNVLVKSGAYKLDGAVMQLPNFFAGATKGTKEVGKVVNVQFDGGFQNADYLNTKKDGKKALTLNTDLLAGNQVNFILPAGNYDVNIETTQTEASLSGADTNIGYFTFKCATDKSATSIKSGVTIKRAVEGIGDIKMAGGALEAKVISGAGIETQTDNWNSTDGEGFTVGGQAKAYNLFIESGTPTIANVGSTATKTVNDSWKIGTVTIAKGAGVIFNEKKPYISSIIGLDDGCTITFNDTDVDWARGGTTTNLDNVGSVEKGKLSLGDKLILSNTILKNVELLTPAQMNNTSYAEGLTFNALTLNFNQDNQTVTFNACKFNAQPTFTGSFTNVTSAWSTIYEWIVDANVAGAGYWAAVKDNDVANLKEYNKSETVQEFASTTIDVAFNAAGEGSLSPAWNAYMVTSKVIKVNYQTTKALVPENIFVALNNCKFSQADINAAFGNKSNTQKWFTLTVDGVACVWKQDTAGKFWPVKP